MIQCTNHSKLATETEDELEQKEMLQTGNPTGNPTSKSHE